MSFSNLEQISIFVALASVLVSVMATIYALRGRSKQYQLHVREDLKSQKKRGLILLVGPSKGSAPAAIDFHIPELKYCWLIGTKESLNTIQQLIQSYESLTFYWGDGYIVEPDEINSTYNTVSAIFSHESSGSPLSKDDIISDITGGLKPMAAGMALACTSYQSNMQYMKAPRDEAGVVMRDGIPEPVRVDITFEPK